MDDVEIPEYFICPISLQIMRDPVTAITGITYDRESIENWLFKGNNTCPVTKQPLSPDSDLTPNHTLRRLIQSWCTENASNGVVRIPTPKAPLTKSHVVKLVKELWVPQLQVKTLRKLELLAMENERNRRYMVEAGVVKSMSSFLVACFNKQQTVGLEEALSILYLIRVNPTSETRLLPIENDRIMETFTWILQCKMDGHSSIKAHALLVLKVMVKTASSTQLERLKPEFLSSVVGVLREGISHQGINAALHILLDTCPWGRNRMSMIESGAIHDIIEIELGMPERRTTELILGILFHLCSCADGRSQFLSHSGAIAVVSNRVLNVSIAADDRAILILSLISKYCGTCVVLEEMISVRAVSKLCVVLQADYAHYLKEKAREILRSHYDFWKNSPCFISSPLSKIQLI